MVASKLADLKQGGDRGNQHTGGKTPIGALPLAASAQALSVSLKSVDCARVAAKIADMKLGDNQHTATAVTSQADAAEAVHVSVDSIQ